MIELPILKNREIVLLSGKGGTGKTTVSAAFAHLASQRPETSAVLIDADVDAANLELILKPEIGKKQPYSGGKIALIDPALCISCGICADVCRFDAVIAEPAYEIDALACEGCAACLTQCPTAAITMIPTLDGYSFASTSRFGPLYHAALLPGAENSGKLVTHVRKAGGEAARKGGYPLTIIDGPPGMGCAVIAASTGTDLAVVVTEPTASGIADLERILATTGHFSLPTMVILNKADIYPEGAEMIATFCEGEGIPLIARVSFDTAVTEAMVNGQPITDYDPEGKVSAELSTAWSAIVAALK